MRDCAERAVANAAAGNSAAVAGTPDAEGGNREMTNITALETRFNELTEDLDSLAIVDGIIAFCDYAGINAANAMRAICATHDWKLRSKEENFIADMIEMSQSAYLRSIHAIRQAIEIAEEMDNTEF